MASGGGVRELKILEASITPVESSNAKGQVSAGHIKLTVPIFNSYVSFQEYPTENSKAGYYITDDDNFFPMYPDFDLNKNMGRVVTCALISRSLRGFHALVLLPTETREHEYKRIGFTKISWSEKNLLRPRSALMRAYMAARRGQVYTS